MCRNIRVLHHFKPPTSADEMRDAALQYVRKVSGQTRPRVEDEAVFQQAVDEITASTQKLLAALVARGEPRTRDGERDKAKRRWQMREVREAKR